ncbi:MAG: MATE family efflux transporter [Polyangiaceae bacterium]|jgi:putative MATE family efflux protein|nr:MATE family efflux transporter [Polyangiaceae bacterium]
MFREGARIAAAMTEQVHSPVFSSGTRADAATRRILEGGLAWELARFGTPLALAMGLQVTFNLVDAYLIARLGRDTAGPSLGAIGICDQIAALGSIISYGVSIATAAILALHHGRGDREGVRRVARDSLLVVGLLSVVFGLAGVLFAEPLIRDVVGAKGQVAELSVRYLRVIVGGSFSIFFLLQLTTIQRALGSSKTPVAILVGSNVLNLVLAVLLVYGPGEAPPVFSWGPPIAQALGIPRLELVGAAWATVLARMAFLVPLLAVVQSRFQLFRGRLRRPWDSSVLRRLVSIAWPASTQLVVRITAMLLTHSLVARAFTTPVDQRATTALGIVFRLETLALFIGMGWGSAAQTFLGQNLGARQLPRALRSGWFAAFYNVAWMIALAACFLAFAPQVVRFFDDDPDVVSTAVCYLSIVAPSYVALGAGIALGSAITGAGATKLTLTVDAFVVMLFQLPLSLWAVSGAHPSQTHLWWTLASTNVVFAIAYAAVYRGGGFVRGFQL